MLWSIVQNDRHAFYEVNFENCLTWETFCGLRNLSIFVFMLSVS